MILLAPSHGCPERISAQLLWKSSPRSFPISSWMKIPFLMSLALFRKVGSALRMRLPLLRNKRSRLSLGQSKTSCPFMTPCAISCVIPSLQRPGIPITFRAPCLMSLCIFIRRRKWMFWISCPSSVCAREEVLDLCSIHSGFD